MADNSKMLLFGGAAAAAYWYFYLRTPSPVVAPVTGAPVVPVVPGAPVVPVNYFPIQGANTVSAIQARVILAAKAPAEGLGIDEWGFFLNQALEPLGMSAPDPMPLFQAASPGFDRSQKVTASQYFNVMNPALKAQGLAGLGIWGRR